MTIGVGNNGAIQMGSVNVVTTSNTGLPIEHWAERLLDRIVYVASDSDSVIKQQALMFKDEIRTAIIQHITQAIKSDRTTLYNMLLKQGETEMAEILRRLS